MSVNHGQKLTIAHNCQNEEPTRLVLGCTSKIMKSNIVNSELTDVVDIELRPRR